MIESLSPKYIIEQGFITESHAGEGTVRVRTASGRTLENLPLTSILAGPGFGGISAMPLPHTECLVLILGEKYHIIGLFPPEGERYGANDPSAATKPGDFRMNLEHGHVHFGQDGTFDFMAHPWLRMMFVGREHMLREFMQKWERISSPLNHMRMINDEQNELSLFELFMNDRFIYRENDASPSIIWTLGRNHPDIASEGNPGSDFLSLFQVERRLDSTSDVTGRSKDEQGLVDGVSRRETDWVKLGDVSIIEERGNQDGVARRLSIEMVEDTVSHETKEGKFVGNDGDAVFHKAINVGGDSILDIEVLDSGLIKITNPSWTITIKDSKVMTIESEDTRIQINGERINIGGQGGMEPLVLGGPLVDLLSQMINWALTHAHPTPAGPSGPPLQAPQLTAILNSFALAQGAPNATITSNANYVSEGSKYPSSGDAETVE